MSNKFDEDALHRRLRELEFQDGPSRSDRWLAEDPNRGALLLLVGYLLGAIGLLIPALVVNTTPVWILTSGVGIAVAVLGIYVFRRHRGDLDLQLEAIRRYDESRQHEGRAE